MAELGTPTFTCEVFMTKIEEDPPQMSSGLLSPAEQAALALPVPQAERRSGRPRGRPRKREKPDPGIHLGELVEPVPLQGYDFYPFEPSPALETCRFNVFDDDETAKQKANNRRFADKWSLVHHMVSKMDERYAQEPIDHPYPAMYSLQTMFHMATGQLCRHIILHGTEIEKGRNVHPCLHPGCPSCWYFRVRYLLETIEQYQNQHNPKYWYLRTTNELWTDSTIMYPRRRPQGQIIHPKHRGLFNGAGSNRSLVGVTYYTDRDARQDSLGPCAVNTTHSMWGLIGVWASNELKQRAGYRCSKPGEQPWVRDSVRILEHDEFVSVTTELYSNPGDAMCGVLRSLHTPDRGGIPMGGDSFGLTGLDYGELSSIRTENRYSIKTFKKIY